MTDRTDPRFPNVAAPQPSRNDRPWWRRSPHISAYVLIAIVCLFCHWLLLTNDGPLWDGWYVYSWLRTNNWPPMYDFFSSVGMPTFAWLYWPFRWAPSIVGAFMWATVLCFYASGILTYRLALELANVTRAEALILSLLMVAMPLFTAAQDLIMFFFVFTHTLFLLSAFVIARAIRTSGWQHWTSRIFAVLGFYCCFANSALLVYYGGFYILLFFTYRRVFRLPFLVAALRFARAYPDLLLLPLLTWKARSFFTPQHGYYPHYNEPNLSKLGPGLESFFLNVPAYHLKTCSSWLIAHPAVIVIVLAGALLCSLITPVTFHFERSALATVHWLWFGALLLLLAVFPFAAAGKRFWVVPIGEISRHCILTPLPAAILLFTPLRALASWKRPFKGRAVFPLVALLVVVLGAQVAPVYLKERVEWIFSRSLLFHAVRNDDVCKSSVVFLPGNHLLARQTVYGLYAFKSAFGGMDRFVTKRPPVDNVAYTPLEIDRMIVATTMLPSEFERINRYGRQIRIDATRNRNGATDWQIVARYLRLRYFGPREKFEGYLGSLSTLTVSPLAGPT